MESYLIEVIVLRVGKELKKRWKIKGTENRGPSWFETGKSALSWPSNKLLLEPHTIRRHPFSVSVWVFEQNQIKGFSLEKGDVRGLNYCCMRKLNTEAVSGFIHVES